jgi:pantetheine-phosphate adenylyltransferase
MEIQQFAFISSRRHNMRIAVYPGSFDPITNGHEDIIKRGSKIFDELIVAVGINVDKKGAFNIEERVEFIKKVIEPYNNVRVESFNGLLIDFMREKNATIILKGLRAVSDFEYEFQMALMNYKLDSSVETVFMTTSSQYSYLSSSVVKQVASFGGCVEGLLPDVIIGDIIKKLRRK